MRGLAFAVLVAAAALAGCGAHAVEDAPSLEQIAAATRADSYRFETSMETEGIDDAFSGTATGAAHPGEQRGVIRYRFDGLDEESLVLEVRRIGDETYMRYSGEAFSEDGWSKESTAETDELTGPFGAFSEPHRAADALAQHGRDVETEPGERIDGVITTLYRATVPTVELLGAGATKARRAELEKEIRETDSETSKVEGWAGADGLLRRVEVEIPITEEGKTGRFRLSMRFSDFGKPVDVQVPPASEILDPSKILEETMGAPGPCHDEADPHSPKEVAAAFRKAGFDVTVRCQAGDTRIDAVPAGDDEPIFCGISQDATTPPNVPPHSVDAGNVSCWGPESPEGLAVLRTLLDGL